MEGLGLFRRVLDGCVQGHVLELIGGILAVMVGELARNKGDRIVPQFGLFNHPHFSSASFGVMNGKGLHVKVGLAFFPPENREWVW